MSILFPEFVFAEISSFLGEGPEGDFLRKFTGNCGVRDDIKGSTYRNGVLHSYDDKPAEIRYNRFAVWYRNGKKHREGDKPAYIDLKHSETYSKWFWNGKIHRDGDKPAVIENTKQIWYKNGVIHRENDLPALIDGETQKWYINGELHRENDLPSVIEYKTVSYHPPESIVLISWFNKGKLHRNGDKPAVINGREEYVMKLLDKNLTKPQDNFEKRYLDKHDLLPYFFMGINRQEWYQDGLLHRDCDKPAIRAGYYAVWYKKGKKHRDCDKPFCISGNTALYIVDGKEVEKYSFNNHEWY